MKVNTFLNLFCKLNYNKSDKEQYCNEWKRNKDKYAKERGREIDSVYDRFFEPDFLPSTLFGKGKWGPKIDISEGRKNIIVKAELPGVEKENIDLSLEGRLLTIGGEKKQEKKESDEHYHRVESSFGVYKRTIELPSDVDKSKVHAKYKNGVLKIKLKKTNRSETKKIKINTGK